MYGRNTEHVLALVDAMIDLAYMWEISIYLVGVLLSLAKYTLWQVDDIHCGDNLAWLVVHELEG
jgi:hypothetical protein